MLNTSLDGKSYIERANTLCSDLNTYDYKCYETIVNSVMNDIGLPLSDEKVKRAIELIETTDRGWRFLYYKTDDDGNITELKFESESNPMKHEGFVEKDLFSFIMETPQATKLRCVEDRQGSYWVIIAIFFLKDENIGVPTGKPIEIANDIVELCVNYINSTSKDILRGFYDDVTLLFFTLLWKSIAVGEFYSVDRYKNILNLNNKDQLDKKLHPQLLKYFTTIKTTLEDFCHKIDPHYLMSGTQFIDFDIDIFIEKSNPNTFESFTLSPLLKLTKEILEMTYIDLYYISNHRNTKILGQLFRDLSYFKNEYQTAIGLFVHSRYLGDSCNLKNGYKDTIDLILLKTSVLLAQIINQKVPEEAKELCVKLDVNSSVKEMITLNYNTIYHLTKNKSVFANTHLQKKELNKSVFKNICEANENDPLVKWYDSYIEKGLRTYNQLGELYKIYSDKSYCAQSIDNVFRTTQKIFLDSKTSIELDRIPPSLYVKIILWFNGYIHNKNYLLLNDDKELETIKLIRAVLDRLREYTIHYKTQLCLPYQYRAYFNDSFYDTEGSHVAKKPIGHSDNVIFISSLYYSPFNPVFINDFFLFFNRRLRSMENEKIKEATEGAFNAIQKAEKSNIAAESALDEAQKATKTIAEERARTLQIVGILAAFIAFVSSVVGTQKAVETISDFIVFVIAYLTGVVIFVFCIQMVSITVRDRAEKKAVDRLAEFVSFGIMLFSVLMLLYGVAFAFNNFPKKIDKQKTEEVSTTKYNFKGEIVQE